MSYFTINQDDDPKNIGIKYGIPDTFPNRNKVTVDSIVVLVGKINGTRLLRGYGTVKSVKSMNGYYNKPCLVKWIYWKGSYKKLGKNMSEGVWNKIKNLPNYNVRYPIRVINKEIFDQIVKEGSQQEIDDLIGLERERMLTNELKRNPKFTRQIMEVYKHQCAICGIQIGIVEAAHVQEVRDHGTDEICNGIALCRNHHFAFDMNLITLDTSSGPEPR